MPLAPKAGNILVSIKNVPIDWYFIILSTEFRVQAFTVALSA